MKITRIQADNLLGLTSIDIKLQTPVTLVCGPNGAGKSSIQEAVRMAITQDCVRDINLKKEFAALVHEGAKAGGAQVVIDGDAEKSFAFNMPKGEFSGPEITESMRVALHGQRFARMKPDERRTFLFGLTKLKPNAEMVKARMLTKAWACQEVKIDAVLPLLRTGFPSVCEHAKTKATEAKGAWRALTGETYGSEKAPVWEAPVPEVPAGDVQALANTVAGLDKNIAGMNEQLGAIKAIERAAAEAGAKRAALSASAGKVADLTDQLARAQVELAEYRTKVEALRARAGGKVRVGLVHDMAAYLHGITDMSEVSTGQTLVARYEAEHGTIGGAVDASAQASLPEHEKGLLVVQNRVTNLARDLASATQAKGQFDALAPADDAVDASAQITEVEGMITAARAARTKAENQRLDIDVAIAGAGKAAKKTKDALAHHTDVVEWTKVAKALAPDGIPNEMLLEALAPVNAALEQAALDTEWMRVKIGADMAITAAGRPYQLLSESEQWRADAMIAQVVAEISGLKILMLDRVDVLDLKGRAQLFDWMDALAFNGIIDTALLFATLKALPVGLADTVTAYWVEGGEIAGQRQQAAA